MVFDDGVLVKLVRSWPSSWIEDKSRREFIQYLAVPEGVVPVKEDVDFVKALLPPNHPQSQVVADWLDARLLGIPEDGERSRDSNYENFDGIRMLDLFRVTVHFHQHNDDDDAQQCHKVYGEISVTDFEDEIVMLFSRRKEAPLFVPQGGSLPLNVSKECALSLSTASEVRIRLRDVGDDDNADVEIVNGSFSVDYDTVVNYDQAIAHTVTGEYGYATVHYAKLACADFTQLDVQVSGFTGNVYGSLVVHHTNIRDEENQRSSVVCIMPENEPVNVVDTGTTIPLSRSLLSVPSFSPLVLVFEANIWDHASGVKLVDQVFTGLELKEIMWNSTIVKQIKGINGLLVELKAQWFHPYILYPEEFTSVDDWCVNPPILPMTGWTNLSPASAIISYDDGGIYYHLVEVFSIAVGSRYTNGSPPSVCGEISISDGIDTQCIFQQREDCPLRLEQPYSVLPRNRSHLTALRSNYFEIKLRLKDGNNGQILRGYICWSHNTGADRISCYDRRLCSLVVGDAGYAVAHYAFYTYAVVARVRVYICTNDSTAITAEVEGRIDTYYANYEYKTAYERRFFQRTIFEKRASVVMCKPDAAAINWQNCCTLDALVDEAVVVPTDTPLALKTLLGVRLPGEADFEIADVEDVTFQVSSDGTFCKANNQGKYSIVICVDWIDYYYPGPPCGETLP